MDDEPVEETVSSRRGVSRKKRSVSLPEAVPMRRKSKSPVRGSRSPKKDVAQTKITRRRKTTSPPEEGKEKAVKPRRSPARTRAKAATTTKAATKAATKTSPKAVTAKAATKAVTTKAAKGKSRPLPPVEESASEQEEQEEEQEEPKEEKRKKVVPPKIKSKKPVTKSKARPRSSVPKTSSKPKSPVRHKSPARSRSPTKPKSPARRSPKKSSPSKPTGRKAAVTRRRKLTTKAEEQLESKGKEEKLEEQEEQEQEEEQEEELEQKEKAPRSTRSPKRVSPTRARKPARTLSQKQKEIAEEVKRKLEPPVTIENIDENEDSDEDSDDEEKKSCNKICRFVKEGAVIDLPEEKLDPPVSQMVPKYSKPREKKVGKVPSTPTKLSKRIPIKTVIKEKIEFPDEDTVYDSSKEERGDKASPQLTTLLQIDPRKLENGDYSEEEILEMSRMLGEKDVSSTEARITKIRNGLRREGFI